MSGEGQPLLVHPVEQRLQRRQRGGIVAERQLQQPDDALVHHARVLLVRFGGQVGVMQVTLPYAKIDNYPNVARNNFIDDKLIGTTHDSA